MKYKNLIQLVEKQKSNLFSLLEIILKKQDALVNNNFEKLEVNTQEEEKVLLEINRCEKQRLDVLDKFYKENPQHKASCKLDDIISVLKDKINGDLSQKLISLKEDIKNVTKKIILINQQNKYLIVQSRSLFNEIVTNVFKNNSSIIDRKI